jgi:tetratricopeptide (TPR) repeat protein
VRFSHAAHSDETRFIRIANAGFICLACFTLPLQDADARVPNERAARMTAQVVAIEGADSTGNVVMAGTGLIDAPDSIVTLCRNTLGLQIRVRKDSRLLDATPLHRDVLRNLCIYAVPGLGGIRSELATKPAAVGARVYAVSNGLNLGIALSEGVLAAYTAEGESQFTAPVAIGSEGGALFDGEGRLIGLIGHRRPDGQNISFAFPASWIAEVPARSAEQQALARWMDKSRQLHQENKLAELAAHAHARTKALPDDVSAWGWLAYAEQAQGNLEPAKTAYRKLLELEPRNAVSLVALSAIQLAQNQAVEARRLALEATARFPGEASAWFILARAERAGGNLAAARPAIEEARRLNPIDKTIQFHAADIALAQGDFSGAISILRGTIQLDRMDAEPWLALSHAYYARHDLIRSLDAAEKAIELGPENGRSWQAYARALAHAGRYKDALKAARHGLSLASPGDEWLWEVIGAIHMKLEMYPEAVDAYRNALRLAPQRPQLGIDLVTALKDNGDHQESIALAKSLLEKHPENALLWRQVGFNHMLLRQSGEATVALERSAALDAKQPRVWRALIEAYQIAGRQQDVRKAYEKLLLIDRDAATEAYRARLLPYGTVQ